MDQTVRALYDRMGQKCDKCKNGYYEETSIYDDWEGNLHCTKCNHEVKRYQSQPRG